MDNQQTPQDNQISQRLKVQAEDLNRVNSLLNSEDVKRFLISEVTTLEEAALKKVLDLTVTGTALEQARTEWVTLRKVSAILPTKASSLATVIDENTKRLGKSA